MLFVTRPQWLDGFLHSSPDSSGDRSASIVARCKTSTLRGSLQASCCADPTVKAHAKRRARKERAAPPPPASERNASGAMKVGRQPRKLCEQTKRALRGRASLAARNAGKRTRGGATASSTRGGGHPLADPQGTPRWTTDREPRACERGQRPACSRRTCGDASSLCGRTTRHPCLCARKTTGAMLLG